MTTDFEALHPRAGTGQFTEKHNTTPSKTLTAVAEPEGQRQARIGGELRDAARIASNAATVDHVRDTLRSAFPGVKEATFERTWDSETLGTEMQLEMLEGMIQVTDWGISEQDPETGEYGAYTRRLTTAEEEALSVTITSLQDMEKDLGGWITHEPAEGTDRFLMYLDYDGADAPDGAMARLVSELSDENRAALLAALTKAGDPE